MATDRRGIRSVARGAGYQDETFDTTMTATRILCYAIERARAGIAWRTPEMLLRSVVIFIAFGMLIDANIAEAQTGSAPSPTPSQTVLVLSSERSDLPSIPAFQRGLREKLSAPDGKIEFFVEYLDFGRFPGQAQEAAFARYLRERYSGRRIDVIVPFLEAALEFLLAHREELLFTGIPVVAAGTERRHAEGAQLPPGITTIPIIHDYDRTLGLALALQPDAREVLVVHGVADYDLRRLEEARRSLERHAPRLRYRMVGGVPLPEIENAVRNLPSQSFVLFLSMVRDAEGRSLVGQDYAGRFAEVSPVPIYGTFGSHVARGTLGGAITDAAAIGQVTSAVVSQVLSGNPPSGMIAVEMPEPPLQVNWRAIEKWRIPPQRIPPDAEILFRESRLWDAYRNIVLAALAALLLQAALITALVLQLRRRRRAESAVKESEERFRLAADAANLGMWGWNPSHDRLWATENCRTLHGLPQAGHITFRAFTDVVHPEDKENVRRTVQQALHDRVPFAAEYRVMPPAGDVRWIATRGRGSYRNGVEPTGVLGVAVDITERKQAEETLRLTVEALPMAILMVNQQGTIVLANEQAEKLLGYAAAELPRQSVEVLLPERFRSGDAAHRAGFFLAPQVHAMAANRDLSVRRKDGTEIPVEIALNPVRSVEGLLTLAAIVDLSQRYELRRKQHELEHIARVSAMGEIAASLAHELNQPLTAILSNTQAALRLLDRRGVDQAEIREILQDVVADDKRAGEVIGTLRTLLRRGKTEARRMDLSNTVRDVLMLLHSELVGHHVEVETVLAADSFVLADRTQTEQVLLNLVMNGMDAMRQRPAGERRLRIEVARIGETAAQIAVRDSGMGISDDDREKVFDAFWTTKSMGMGMGLAVCKSIVESYGGRIWMERNNDRGVTFFFTLPLAINAQSAPEIQDFTV
jgi:two-component system, LuxR family, sensor kinase FixL